MTKERKSKGASKASTKGNKKIRSNTDSWENDAKDLFGFSDTNCHCCGVSNQDIGGFLLQCAACRKAYYCSMACFNKHLPKHLEFCDTNALEQEPEGRKKVKKKEQPAKKEAQEIPAKEEVKRNFINDESCSESDTETESMAGKRRFTPQKSLDATKDASGSKSEPDPASMLDSLAGKTAKNGSTRASTEKRTFNDGSCSESDTETESMAGKRCFTPQTTGLLGAAEEASELKLDPEPESMLDSIAAKTSKKGSKGTRTAKRTFNDGSCSESDTETESMAGKRRFTPQKTSFLGATKDASGSKSGPEPESMLNSFAEKTTKKGSTGTSTATRFFNDGSCSESDTETESKAGKRCFTPQPTSLFGAAKDASKPKSDPEPESRSTLAQPRPKSLNPQSTMRNFNDGVCSESETESENECDGKDTARASASILNAPFKGVPQELDICESVCDSSDSELDSEEWETDDSGSYCTEELVSLDDARSRDTGSLDMVMEVTEKDSDNDISDEEDDHTCETGVSQCPDIPQFDVSKAIMKTPPATSGCPTTGTLLCRTGDLESGDRAAVRPSRSSDDFFLGADDANGQENRRGSRANKRAGRKQRTRKDDDSASDLTSDGEGGVYKRRKARTRKMRKSDSASDLTSSDGDERISTRRKARTGKVLCREGPRGPADSAARKPSRSAFDSDSQESDDSSSIGEQKSAEKNPVTSRSVGFIRKDGIEPQKRRTGDSGGYSSSSSGSNDSSSRNEVDHKRVNVDDDGVHAQGDNEKIRMQNRLTKLWTLPKASVAVTGTSRRRKVKLSTSMRMEGPRMNDRLGNLWKLPETKPSAEVAGEGELVENEEGCARTGYAEWSDCEESDVEETRVRRGGGVIGSRADIEAIGSHAANPSTNRTESATSVVLRPAERSHAANPSTNRTESATSVVLRPAERTESNVEWKKPEWTESQLCTTEQGEAIKTRTMISPTKSLESAGPEWTRQKPLRATSKGAKLRRQESLRGDRNLARKVTNESIDQNNSLALSSKLGLRPTAKGQLLTRGLSIRAQKQRDMRSRSGLSRSSSNSSSNGSGSSFPAARERRGGLKKDGSIRLTKQRSIRPRQFSGLSRSSSNGSSSLDEEAFMLPKGSIGRGKLLQKESSVNLKRQGSFRVTRGDLDMTLNIVKVELEEAPAFCRPTVLRTTSRGARLMRGESIRKSKKQQAPVVPSPEQSMFADFHASMDQLGASVAEMGFCLEGANDEE